MWIIMLTEWANATAIKAECFGPFEDEQEARDAAYLFLRDCRYCSIHEIKSLPSQESING